MWNETDPLQKTVNDLQQQVAALKKLARYRGLRTRSSVTLLGLPLYDIALGPDPESGQIRGHANGVFAIGDIATGILAFGGLARGVVAVGGLALGVLSIGGLAVGAIAVGGAAVGLVAVGGAAGGLVAVGGGALGYYACGGGAFGKHVLSALRQDPEALRFFKNLVPWLP